MAAVCRPKGRTLPQLAAAMHCTRREARQILGELEQDGWLERVGTVSWRLSAEAERRYGDVLRGVTL